MFVRSTGVTSGLARHCTSGLAAGTAAKNRPPNLLPPTVVKTVDTSNALAAFASPAAMFPRKLRAFVDFLADAYMKPM